MKKNDLDVTVSNGDHIQEIEIEQTTDVQIIDVEGDEDDANDLLIDIYDRFPEYSGQYEVTPKLEAQTLSTAFKTMNRDVEIKEIPITRVSNTSGGNTVIIGG